MFLMLLYHDSALAFSWLNNKDCSYTFLVTHKQLWHIYYIASYLMVIYSAIQRFQKILMFAKDTFI